MVGFDGGFDLTLCAFIVIKRRSKKAHSSWPRLHELADHVGDTCRAVVLSNGVWPKKCCQDQHALAFGDFLPVNKSQKSLRHIRLPGKRTLVVDAKTSLSAYLDAFEAADEVERDRQLALHAQQVRTHVKLLSGKAYWDGLTETPDFVVMFVPGENFYAAAVERDPALFEDAIALKVIIVTPATLIALAKAIAFGWRQERVAENARQVHELGQELYKRILSMVSHATKFGSSLEATINHFNGFVGSIERSVLPQARRFRDLEIEGTNNEIPVVNQIDVVARELRAPELMQGGEQEAKA